MRTDIIMTLKGLAEIFEKTVTTDLMEIWNKVLQDLSPQELGLAVKAYVLDPENVFFPRPGQIYGLARPQENAEDQARLITEKLFMLLGPCGSDQVGVARAKERLCEFGWAYVQMLGGWSKFADDMKHPDMDDLTSLKAQTRGSIKALIIRKKNDISLLPAENTVSLSSLGVTIKSIDQGSTKHASRQTYRTREAEYQEHPE